MMEFHSEFEELVKDLNLSNADSDFNLIFSDFNFDVDADKVNATIDELYIKSEISKRELEKLDEVLEKLNGESIKELLREVYGEEVKGRSVSFLTKQLESKTDRAIDSNRTSSASYKTARDELSEYDSMENSDSSSEYDSCIGSNISSPVVLKSEEDLFPRKKWVDIPQEKITENTVTQNYTENEVAFRISEEEKIEETAITETTTKSNQADFRVRKILSIWPKQHGEMAPIDKTEIIKKCDEEKKNVTVKNITENEVVFRLSEKIEEKIIIDDENEKVEMSKGENKNQTSQTSKHLPDSIGPKRKMSDKAKKISESIIGQPLKPLGSDDSSQKLQSISTSLVTKNRPNRKSSECSSSKKEFELKLQEIRKKMELRNTAIGGYQSVYSTH